MTHLQAISIVTSSSNHPNHSHTYCFSCETTLHADTDSYATCFICGCAMCDNCSRCACDLRQGMHLVTSGKECKEISIS